VAGALAPADGAGSAVDLLGSPPRLGWRPEDLDPPGPDAGPGADPEGLGAGSDDMVHVRPCTADDANRSARGSSIGAAALAGERVVVAEAAALAAGSRALLDSSGEGPEAAQGRLARAPAPQTGHAALHAPAAAAARGRALPAGGSGEAPAAPARCPPPAAALAAQRAPPSSVADGVWMSVPAPESAHAAAAPEGARAAGAALVPAPGGHAPVAAAELPGARIAECAARCERPSRLCGLCACMQPGVRWFLYALCMRSG